MAVTDPSNPGALLADAQAVMRAIWDAPYPPEVAPYMVDATERAWIVDPVGDAPSWRAVQVALALGAIDGSHLEVQRMMRYLHEGGQ